MVAGLRSALWHRMRSLAGQSCSWGSAILVGGAIAFSGCGDSKLATHPCVPLGCHSAVRSPSPDRKAPSRAARLLRVIALRSVAPHYSNRGAVEFRDRQYALEIANAGSPNAYTLASTVLRAVRVMRDSSATINVWLVKRPAFVSRAARMRWKASGSPPLPEERSATSSWTVPPRSFSFTPQGAPLTFEEARGLPSSPTAVAQRFRTLLSAHGKSVEAALLLRQYGFVLGTAPISRWARIGVLRAMAMLSRLFVCGHTPSRAGKRADIFCVRGSPTQTEVVLNPQNGVALAVRERLEEPATLYPNIAVGDLVDSDTFR